MSQIEVICGPRVGTICYFIDCDTAHNTTHIMDAIQHTSHDNLQTLPPNYIYTDSILGESYECTVASYKHHNKFWWTIQVWDKKSKKVDSKREFYLKVTEFEHVMMTENIFTIEKFFALLLDALFYHRESVVKLQHFFVRGPVRLGDMNRLRKNLAEDGMRKKVRSPNDDLVLWLTVAKAEFYVILEQMDPDDKHRLRFEPQHLVRLENLELRAVPEIHKKFATNDLKFDALQKDLAKKNGQLVQAIDRMIKEKFEGVIQRLQIAESENAQVRADNIKMQERIVDLQEEVNSMRKEMNIMRYKFNQEVRQVTDYTDKQIKTVQDTLNAKVKRLSTVYSSSSSPPLMSSRGRGTGTGFELSLDLPSPKKSQSSSPRRTQNTSNGYQSRNASPSRKSNTPSRSRPLSASSRKRRSSVHSSYESPKYSTEKRPMSGHRRSRSSSRRSSIDHGSNWEASRHERTTSKLSTTDKSSGGVLDADHSGFTFSWSSQKKHPKLLLSPDKQILRCISKLNAQTCLAGIRFAKDDQGVYEWDIRLVKSESTEGPPALYIGVADPSIGVKTRCGFTDRSWALYLRNGKGLHNGIFLDYYPENIPFVFRENDTISLTLDMQKGELSYSLNGHNLGVCFQNIEGPVCPAITFMDDLEVCLA
mmetsp:Transcript_6455/g.24241  ORF Transcript_6455/g.24241 Transcript_6455/m.24241 type:complete len:648 (-) Transcript_6455:3531-5474(-)